MFMLLTIVVSCTYEMPRDSNNAYFVKRIWHAFDIFSEFLHPTLLEEQNIEW